MSRDLEQEKQTSRDKKRKANLSIDFADAIAELVAGRKEKHYFLFRHDKENYEIRMYRLIKSRDFSERPHRSKFVREFIGTLPDHIVHIDELDEDTLARLSSISSALPAHLQFWLEQRHAQYFAQLDRLTCPIRLERELSLLATICSEGEDIDALKDVFEDEGDLAKRLQTLWHIVEERLRICKLLD